MSLTSVTQISNQNTPLHTTTDSDTLMVGEPLHHSLRSTKSFRARFVCNVELHHELVLGGLPQDPDYQQPDSIGITTVNRRLKPRLSVL